jgi:hypothetical protein
MHGAEDTLGVMYVRTAASASVERGSNGERRERARRTQTQQGRDATNMYPVICIEYMREATFWPVDMTLRSYKCGGRFPSSDTTVDRTACCTSMGAVSAKPLISSGAEMFCMAST